MKVTKITEAQLQTLIREQAIKYKRVLELEARRDEIKKQLNEMYGANETGEVDEIFGLGQTPEQKAVAAQEKGMAVINANRNFKTIYANLLQKEPAKAPLMVQYLAAHPDAKGIKWNPARNEFADINDNITGNLLQRMAAGTGSLTGGGGVGTKPTE